MEKVGHLRDGKNAQLKKVRALFSWLISNRKRAWENKDFFIQSKLNDLTQFERNFEAIEQGGRLAHYRLIYNYQHEIRNIIPGENSRYKNKREELIDLLDKALAYYEERIRPYER